MTNRNIAVIGAGYWGKNLVRNFYQIGVLKTICDGEQSTLKQMSLTYPEVQVSDNTDAVLNDGEIEGVVIAAPAVMN